MQIIKLSVNFLLLCISIIMVGSIPFLIYDIDRQIKVLKMIESNEIENTLFLYDSVQFNIVNYFNHVQEMLGNIFSIQDFQYYKFKEYHPVFPELNQLYLMSAKYLIAALCIGLILAVTFSFLIMLLPTTQRDKVKKVLFVVESLPDIFIIFLLQFLIIWIYKKTDILLFQIVNVFGKPAFFLPVLCLSILPSIYITKYLLISLEEEEKQSYVEMAKGKGLSMYYIIFVHILRNAIFTLLFHFKTIFWFSLSNLFVLEIIFNIHGIMTHIKSYGSMNPDLVTVSILLIFIPYYCLFHLGSAVISKKIKGDISL